MTSPDPPVLSGPDELAAAILQSRKPALPAFAVGTVVSINPTLTGNLVTVSGVADINLVCQSTGSFDSAYSTAGAAIIGSLVIVITIAGQPIVLTTTTNGA